MEEILGRQMGITKRKRGLAKTKIKFRWFYFVCLHLVVNFKSIFMCIDHNAIVFMTFIINISARLQCQIFILHV